MLYERLKAEWATMPPSLSCRIDVEQNAAKEPSGKALTDVDAMDVWVTKRNCC